MLEFPPATITSLKSRVTSSNLFRSSFSSPLSIFGSFLFLIFLNAIEIHSIHLTQSVKKKPKQLYISEIMIVSTYSSHHLYQMPQRAAAVESPYSCTTSMPPMSDETSSLFCDLQQSLLTPSLNLTHFVTILKGHFKSSTDRESTTEDDLLLDGNDDLLCHDRFGFTPLHVLTMSSNPDINLCREVLKRYPEAVSTEDYLGALPIDYALKNNAPVEIIQLLVPDKKAKWDQLIKGMIDKD